jgi:small-conductance mechanosensitive channel
MVDYLPPITPVLAPALVVAVMIAALWLTDYVTTARARKKHKSMRLLRQSIKLGLLFVGALALVLVLPLGDTTQGQLLTIFGLIITAVLTLSSTTFVANGLAGVMLRSVENFRPGDFLRVGDDFGRVTERGLLHTEIQTEDGDLTTLPNLHLISTPYTTVRSSGTVVSATVSLGYDVPHGDVEDALLVAATDAELEQAFVQIVDLQDYSVVYRIGGFLTEPKQLLSSRSSLRKRMLDTLHRRGIEIVSPTFMNQRRIDDRPPFIPRVVEPAGEVDEGSPIPEDKIFDKAEMAQAIEELREEKRELEQGLEDLKAEHDTAAEARQPLLTMRMEYTKNRLEAIKRLFDEHNNSD